MEKTAHGTIAANGKTVSVDAPIGELLLDTLNRAGIGWEAPCGGNGTCGKCRVFAGGALSEPDEAERKKLGADAEKGIRLACRCRVEGDFALSLVQGKLRVETDFSVPTRPMGESGAAGLGLAVDIGTTTVAVYLCALADGRVLGVRGFRNPQAIYGADVISRIDKIMKNSAMLRTEQTALLRAIGEAACALLADAGGQKADVREALFCGNTVMEHIAAGLNPSPLAVAPFTPVSLFGTEISSDAIGFDAFPKLPIYFAPCFASYVGGDIACGVRAVSLPEKERAVLFLDIGTNGEIALSVGDHLYLCATAAGPALEGACLSCGMAGTDGAICGVLRDGGSFTLRTVGDAPPCGICGSGVIDAVALLLETGLLDETGRFVRASEAGAFAPWLGETSEGAACFWLDRARELSLDGADIRKIQLAKAAIAAGVRTLASAASISLDRIDEVILAGGFGSHLRASSVCRIGLLPSVLRDKIRFAGNTAGAGAILLLTEKRCRAEAEALCREASYLELSASADFAEAYVEEMGFETDF